MDVDDYFLRFLTQTISHLKKHVVQRFKSICLENWTDKEPRKWNQIGNEKKIWHFQ